MTRTQTKTSYFAKCRCIEELKKLYKELAMRWHPDRPDGDLETMQFINAEYDIKHEQLKDIHVKKDGNTWEAKGDWRSNETAKMYRDVIEALIHMKGVEIEICGGWLWASGETKQYAELLKSLKFLFSGSKKAWYYNGGMVKTRISHCKNLQEVRDIWGSVKVKDDDSDQSGQHSSKAKKADNRQYALNA